MDARGIAVSVEIFHTELEGAVDDYLVLLANPGQALLREAFRRKMDFIVASVAKGRLAEFVRHAI